MRIEIKLNLYIFEVLGEIISVDLDVGTINGAEFQIKRFIGCLNVCGVKSAFIHRGFSIQWSKEYLQQRHKRNCPASSIKIHDLLVLNITFFHLSIVIPSRACENQEWCNELQRQFLNCFLKESSFNFIAKEKELTLQRKRGHISVTHPFICCSCQLNERIETFSGTYQLICGYRNENVNWWRSFIF